VASSSGVKSTNTQSTLLTADSNFSIIVRPEFGSSRKTIGLRHPKVFWMNEANQFLEELEGLLLREAIEEPDEGDLVGKAKPVMRAPALAELHEIFLGQAGGAFELVAGKHYRCDTANAEVRKDGSLAYKIT
jgi:hypothetical protein